MKQIQSIGKRKFVGDFRKKYGCLITKKHHNVRSRKLGIEGYEAVKSYQDKFTKYLLGLD